MTPESPDSPASRERLETKVIKLSHFKLYANNTTQMIHSAGDIGGRCSDCRPGFKGDKGERGFNGAPGLMGKEFILIWVSFQKVSNKID